MAAPPAPRLLQKSREHLAVFPPARTRAAAVLGPDTGPRSSSPQRSARQRRSHAGRAREDREEGPAAGGTGWPGGLGAVVRCRPPPRNRERRRTTAPRVPRGGPAPRWLVQHVVRLTRPAPAPPAAPRPAAAPPLPSPGTAGQRGRGAAALPRPSGGGRWGRAGADPGRGGRVQGEADGGCRGSPDAPQEGRGLRAAWPCPLAARPWHAPGPAPSGVGPEVLPGSACSGREVAGARRPYSLPLLEALPGPGEGVAAGAGLALPRR